MDLIKIVIGKTDWQFIEKEDDRTVEVINTKTKKSFTGFINSLSSSGTYMVELKEEIEDSR